MFSMAITIELMYSKVKIFFIILLLYNSCIYTTIYIYIYIYIYVGFTPSIIILLEQDPLLIRTISTGFILLFSYMDTKYIHHIHFHSHFTCAHPLPVTLTPRKDLFFPPAIHFFLKVNIDSPRGFCLATSVLYISCFNKICKSKLH
jgi:hypothetical protein